MINAENIGKRIRLLRKQKRVSQERMAEDLGMYQADISNLERAIGGSGITDLFKLDLIADYFGIALIELLNGPEPLADIASGTTMTEEHEMKDYMFTNAAFGNEGAYFYAEITLTTPDQKNIYFSFSECNDEPRFYRTTESLFKQLSVDRGVPSHEKKLNKHCFLSGEDYIEIFESIESKYVRICRLLIFIATEDYESVRRLIDNCQNKTLEEIDIPIPSREPEDLFSVNYSDLAVVYRYRLMVEASLKNPSVYDETEDTIKREKLILSKLKAACASEDAYKVWKKDLIDVKIKEVMEKQKVLACTYIFAGMGQYKEMLPEEMLPSFEAWIGANGSAFLGECRPATKREIRTYVSQHIADELLGIESPLP